MLSKEAIALQESVKQSAQLGQKEFTRILKETKAITKKEKKQFSSIRKKDIMIDRLVYYFLTGHYTTSQLASLMCCSVTTIRRLLSQEDVIEKIRVFQDSEKELIETKLKAIALKSVDTMNELLDSDDDSVRLNASKDILDRTGYKAKDNKDININVSYEENLKNAMEGLDLSFIDTSYTDLSEKEEKILIEGEIKSDGELNEQN